MVRVWAANAAWCSVSFSWIAAFVEGGGGEAAIISCEQGDAGLVCSRNTTVVDNTTEIVEVRLQIDRASLQSTEISVPGYRLIIEIPDEEGGGFMNSITGGAMGDNMGVGSIILGNLAAMASLVVFCGLIGAIAGHKNKAKIDEMQGHLKETMEMAGIVPADDSEDSEDEDALYMTETGDGISLDKKALAANAANTWRASTKKGGGKKGGKFSAFAALVSQVAQDPHAQEMLRHAKEDAEALVHTKMMNPMDQGKKVLNPMRDSGAALSSPLGEGLLGGGSSHTLEGVTHALVDGAKRPTKNPMAEVIADAAHKKLDSAGIAEAGKNKSKK
jgi:hypothetical protein